MLTRRNFLAASLTALLPRVAWGAPSTQETVRMVYSADVAPYSYWDESTQTVRGILIDLMDLAAQSAGYALEHEAFPWRRAQLMVENAYADALCCPATKEREAYAMFAPTPVTVLAEGEIFFAADNPKADRLRAARTIEDLYKFSMVSFLGNSRNAEIWAKHPNRTEVRRINQIFDMLLLGHADFYVDDSTVTRFKLKQRGLLGKIVGIPASFTNRGERTKMQFGLRRTYPHTAQVVADFDAAIQRAITPDVHDAVLAKYIR